MITKAFADFFAENSGDEPLDAEGMSQLLDAAAAEGITVPTLDEALEKLVGEDDEGEEAEEEEDDEESD